MQDRSKTYLCAVLALYLMCATAEAKTQVQKPAPAAIAPQPPSHLWTKRIAIRHAWGHQDEKCLAPITNYTTVELFVSPDYRPGRMFPFLDLIGHRFIQDLYAANVGIGGRYVPDAKASFCQMIGVNAFYDTREGCIGHYRQFGIGFELLGSKWDFRANAYLPWGQTQHIRTCLFNSYTNNYFLLRKNIESVSYSMNAEGGYFLINAPQFSLYAACGPYFLSRCCCNTFGFEARIKPQFRDYLALDLSYRYDDLFGVVLQAALSLTFPLYQLSHRTRDPPCRL
ncbi:MAG: inverse autotransporter beta domain-containing protein, partial [Verrucomicrobia bacterium]|nr:inverse autotransporter beta domain-containing protein [Verrucomicrobiota bacterium]